MGKGGEVEGIFQYLFGVVMCVCVVFCFHCLHICEHAQQLLRGEGRGGGGRREEE